MLYVYIMCTAFHLHLSHAMISGTFKENAPHIPSVLSESLLMSSASTLRKGVYYLIGQHLHGAYRSMAGSSSEEPAWVNEYTHFITEADEAGEQRLQQNLLWLTAELGSSADRMCMSHFVPGSVLVQQLEDAESYWPLHLEALRIVQPRVIITYGISDVSPFWFLYEHSEALGDSWDQVKAGQGNWRCKTFTGQYLGQRVPVVGLPHLSRYKLSGKEHVIEWIRGLVDVE